MLQEEKVETVRYQLLITEKLTRNVLHRKIKSIPKFIPVICLRWPRQK